MVDQNGIPTINMTNTKKEMMEAYSAMKEQLQAQEKDLLNSEKMRKQMEKKVAAATADTQAAQDPIKRLYMLRSDISKELTDLAEKFEQEIDTYNKIQAAVKAKQEELDTIYGVETAASDLAALIEAQQTKKETFESEMEKRRAMLEVEIQETRDSWKKEKLAQEQDAKEQTEALKKQRQRDKEEFEYTFEREKELRKNALDDEIGVLQKEIEQKRKDFEQDLNLHRAEIEAREKSVAEKETEFQALQNEVQAFPQKLEKEIKVAVNAATERLTSDFEKSRELLNAKHDGEKNVMVSKIESLEKLVKSQEIQIADLSKRHEQAYEKVQDIANRAVAAAKHETVSVPAPTRLSPDQNEQGKS